MINIFDWIILKRKEFDDILQDRDDVHSAFDTLMITNSRNTEIIDEQLETIDQFQKTNEKLVNELNKTNKETELEDFWNNKRAKIVPKWKARDNISMDLRCFFQTDETLPKFSGTNDTIASDTLSWAVVNIKYKAENGEHWNFAYETNLTKRGDCEDSSILIANILFNSGVPYWRIRLNKGWVNNNNKKIYHAYCTYLREDGVWVLLDVAFYPNECLGLKNTWKKAEKYLTCDCSWNSKYGFGDLEK